MLLYFLRKCRTSLSCLASVAGVISFLRQATLEWHKNDERGEKEGDLALRMVETNDETNHTLHKCQIFTCLEAGGMDDMAM